MSTENDISKLDEMIILLGAIVYHEATTQKTYSHILKHAQRGIKNLSEIKKVIIKESKE